VVVKTGDDTRRATMITAADNTSLFEELDYREGDGIEVSLLWSRLDDELSVLVVDTKSDEQFELRVQGHEAMDVFRHPFAYADARASRDVAALRVAS
jgi:hypothetical protein